MPSRMKNEINQWFFVTSRIGAECRQKSIQKVTVRLLTFDHDALRGMVSRVKMDKKYNRDLMTKRRSEGTGVLRKVSEHSIPLMNASFDTISKLQCAF